MRVGNGSHTTKGNLTRGTSIIRMARTTRVRRTRSKTSMRRVRRQARRARRRSLLLVNPNRVLTLFTRIHRLLILSTGSLNSLSTKRILEGVNISVNNHILRLTINPTKGLTRSSHRRRSRKRGTRRRRNRLMIRTSRHSRSTRSSRTILNRLRRRINRRRQSNINIINRANSRLTRKSLIRLLVKRKLSINRRILTRIKGSTLTRPLRSRNLRVNTNRQGSRRAHVRNRPHGRNIRLGLTSSRLFSKTSSRKQGSIMNSKRRRRGTRRSRPTRVKPNVPNRTTRSLAIIRITLRTRENLLVLRTSVNDSRRHNSSTSSHTRRRGQVPTRTSSPPISSSDHYESAVQQCSSRRT